MIFFKNIFPKITINLYKFWSHLFEGYGMALSFYYLIFSNASGIVFMIFTIKYVPNTRMDFRGYWKNILYHFFSVHHYYCLFVYLFLYFKYYSLFIFCIF